MPPLFDGPGVTLDVDGEWLVEQMVAFPDKTAGEIIWDYYVAGLERGAHQMAQELLDFVNRGPE